MNLSKYLFNLFRKDCNGNLNKFVTKRNHDGSFSKLINKDNNQKLNSLDFSCGFGTHSLVFKDFNIDGYGIDISESAIKIAKKRAEDGDKNKLTVINIFKY